MLKKRLVILLVVFLIVLMPTVFSATKEDVISAINATYQVGNESYRLPQSVINKGTNFLNKKKLSSEQYDKILGTIGSAVSIAQKAGTTDITKISREDLRKGLGLLQEASRAANVDLSEVTGQLSSGIKNDKNTSSSQKASGDKDLNNSVQLEEGQKKIVSGDSIIVVDHSGEVVGVYSGEVNNSGESNSSIDLDALMNTSDENINSIVSKNITIAIVVIAIVLVVLLVVIILIANSKMNKALKVILLILFITLFVLLVAGLLIGFYYFEEIKILYELYLAFS